MIFYRKNFVPQSQNVSYRNPSLLCFRKVLVAKKFFDKKGVGYQDFASKNFCPTVPRNFVAETFCTVCQKICGSEKFMDKKGEYQLFPLEIFRLTVPKNFVGEPYSVSLVSGIENFCDSHGYVTFFHRIFFCFAGTGKPCRGTLL